MNTCEEYAGPVELYKKYGIEQLHLPTIDYTPPSMAAIHSAMEFMSRHVAAGHKVYGE